VILAVLQARSSSTRFPGKVLAPLHGAPMIVRQVERIRRSTEIDRLVVGTSVAPSDDELAAVLDAAGIEVRRGPLDDVVGRFGGIVGDLRPDVVVRLTADCPLTDPAVIDRVIREHRETGADYASNTLRPTYPDGLDVEAVTIGAFDRLLALPLTDREREHVTLGIYSRPDEFRLHNVVQEPPHAGLRWTVDVPEDLDFVRSVYAALYDGKPGFGQDDVLDLLAQHPELTRTDSDLARNAALNGDGPPAE
jgi:spore coat polysaccharide biosynthesis protein SpsF